MDARSLLHPAPDSVDDQPDSTGVGARAGGVGRRRGVTTFTVPDLLAPEGPERIARTGPSGSKFRLPSLSGADALLRPRTAGTALFGFGLLILLVLGYTYSFTVLSGQRAQNQLLASITSSVPGAERATFNLATGVVPPQGRPVAVLDIPAFRLADAVVQGSDAQDLRSGPGHMPTTPLPGQPGNAVIAGRRTTYGAPCRWLASLSRCENIRVVEGYGSLHYVGCRVLTVTGGWTEVLKPTPA